MSVCCRNFLPWQCQQSCSSKVYNMQTQSAVGMLVWCHSKIAAFQVQSVVPHHTALSQAHVVASFGISVLFWFLSLYKFHFRALTWTLLFANCDLSPHYWYHSNYFLCNRKLWTELDECLRLNNNAVGRFWSFLLQNNFFPVHAVNSVLWGMHVTCLSIRLSNSDLQCLTQRGF